MRKRTRFRCVICGKITAGRLGRAGRHTGDGSARFPRKHNGADGRPCPGNVFDADWIDVDVAPAQEQQP